MDHADRDQSNRVEADDDREERLKLAREIAKRYSADTYVSEAGEHLPYLFLGPPDYDPERRYPLVVCLHGAAGRGSDNTTSIAGSVASRVLSEPAARRRYPSFLLVPQAPLDGCWGYALDDEAIADRVRRGRPTEGAVAHLVPELVERVTRSWSVDRDRIYIIGQSMGGAGTWYLTVTRPDLFAAAIPICGPVSACYADAAAHTPVWAFHGDLDETVPVESTREMVAALRAAGGSVRYTEFEGVGHGCMPLVFENPDVLEWLFAQTRAGRGPRNDKGEHASHE